MYNMGVQLADLLQRLKLNCLSKHGAESFLANSGTSRFGVGHSWMLKRIQSVLGQAGIRFLNKVTGARFGVRLREQKKLDDASGRSELFSDALG